MESRNPAPSENDHSEHSSPHSPRRDVLRYGVAGSIGAVLGVLGWHGVEQARAPEIPEQARYTPEQALQFLEKEVDTIEIEFQRAVELTKQTGNLQHVQEVNFASFTLSMALRAPLHAWGMEELPPRYDQVNSVKTLRHELTRAQAYVRPLWSITPAERHRVHALFVRMKQLTFRTLEILQAKKAGNA